MKTETKHTPGPWALGIETDSERAQIINAKGQHVAYVECSPLAPTARLFAAAPELLEALQDVLRYCVTVRGMPDKDKGRTVEQQAAYNKAHAAITKAKGQA